MATKSRNGLGSMLGVLVLAAVLFIVLNMFNLVQVGFGTFGCGWEPNVRFGAMAEAADDDECPSNVTGAMTDASWAADRIASIVGQKPTVGLFYDSDGMEHSFDSQKGADADKALKVGREAGVFPASGRPTVVDHVEVKVAAAMRDSGDAAGVLVINNSGGPCLIDEEGTVAPMSCLSFLPQLLPTDATLTVWWPDPDGGAPHKQTFVGGTS